jgi:molybdopterin molybdotransferase
VPEGADRVLIQEDVAREGEVITLRAGADAARHIRPLGCDFREGERLAPRRLRPTDLGLLAAMNHAEVPVGRRPEVALIATGDELVMPGETPRPDQIVASNSFALKAMFEAEGARVRLLPIARDTEASLTAVFGLAEGADLVVTTGGASVGDHDLVAHVAGTLGLERSFWKIAMRPGKPLMAGRLGGAALLGLPGNPVSSVVCAILFVLPMLRAMQGAPEDHIAPRPHEGVLAEPVEANGPREHYMRARLVGATGLAALPDQDSSLLSVLAAADALLIRPPGDPARPRGFPATWLPL